MSPFGKFNLKDLSITFTETGDESFEVKVIGIVAFREVSVNEALVTTEI